jgi:uncharacterized spore protein YtfJ
MDPTGNATAALSDTAERFAALVERLARVANASSCVGEAHTEGGHTVVPVAVVSVQTGFGMGFGSGSGGQGNEQGQGGGGGGGGGGRASARTIAIVDVSGQGVTVKPVCDVTHLILGVLAFAGFALLSARRGGPPGPMRHVLTGILKSRD